MNPGGILGKKVVAEDMLRRQQQQQEEREGSSVIPYCIVRPTGLKFEDSEWPRGRSLFSQGDVAVGRMNANDLADLLVDLLNEPSATGKTFECVTLAGYPPSTSLSPVLDRLEYDNAATTSDDDSVYTAYMLMQQLLPGENKTVDQITKDLDRDNYLSAADAVEYGLIDRVLDTKQTVDQITKDLDRDNYLSAA